jgi:hypothetical protein
VLVLAAHAVLLGGWDGRPLPPGLAMGEASLPDTARPPRVVVLVQPVAAEAEAEAAGAGAARAPDATEAGEVVKTADVAGASKSAAAAAPAAPVPAAAPSLAARVSGMGAAASTRVANGLSTEAEPEAASQTAADGVPPAVAPAGLPSPYAGTPPPVWTTRLPGDFAVAYALRRGEEAPRVGTLRFESRDGRYALQLQVSGAARGPEQASQGRIDPAGLAPERYLDRRRARSAAAANFDPIGARITYSGAATVQPLFAGTQDRLSWLVQLAAVLEADPTRAQPGARLPLYVSGAHGDAQLWAFEVRGRVPKEGSGSAVDALVHLVREPERPYDLRVEAWLDPSQQHLPARLRLTPVPAGAAFEWWRLP